MDYLWAPKEENTIGDLLNHLGIERVGTSSRFPNGVKYDAMKAISDVLMSEDKFASMVASSLSALQSDRGPKGAGTTEHAIKTLGRQLNSGNINQTELKAAMKLAGLI